MEDPDDLKPEQWLEPDAAVLNETSLPSSLRRHQYVGQNLALLELRMALAPITHCFQLKPANAGPTAVLSRNTSLHSNCTLQTPVRRCVQLVCKQF